MVGKVRNSTLKTITLDPTLVSVGFEATLTQREVSINSIDKLTQDEMVPQQMYNYGFLKLYIRFRLSPAVHL